jgi:hypothetical protein
MSFFLHIVTEKGLRFIQREYPAHAELMQAVRTELHKRGLPLRATLPRVERDHDGYERE